MFLELTAAGAGDFADVLITDFGGAAQWGATVQPMEVAPTLLEVAYSSEGAAHEINIYLAVGAGDFGTADMIRVVTVNALTPITTANYADLIGGQGGCRRVHRTANGTPLQLRVTTTGKTDTATIRVEWIPARGVT
jgi:hypothetical protein